MRRRRLVIVLASLYAALAGVTAGAQTVVPVVVTGESDRRVDLLLLGDGYNSADLPRFAADAATIANALFDEQPFKEYRSYFNIRRIDVASVESGASHPNWGISRNTAFGAYYGCGGSERSICFDQGKVNAALGLVPLEQRDMVLMIVNDTQDGGTAVGAIAITSLNASSMGVALHEIGHAFGWLADEYGGPPPPACVDAAEPSAPNVTKATDRENIKWAAWIEAATPIPTTTTAHGIVGLYQGAKYCDNTLYRPTYDSKMRVSSRPFEQVNVEQLVKRFYAYADQIDSASPPPDTTVTVRTDESRVFSVAVLTPATHALRVVWWLDGVEQPADQGHALQFELSASTLSVGPHRLDAVVSDPTTMVRRDPDGLLAEWVTWPLTVTRGNPDFAVVLDAALRAGLSGTPGARLSGVVTVQAVEGYSGAVNVNCSVSPSGPACSMTPPSVTAGSSAILGVDLAGTQAGAYTITVTGSDGRSTRTAAIPLTVVAPDFQLVPPAALSGDPGTSQRGTVSVVSLRDYSGTVTVGCSVVPAGPTCRVSPGTVAAGGTFTVTLDLGVSNAGTYAVTVTGTDGQRTHSASIQLVVAAGDFAVQSLVGTRLTVSRGQAATVRLTAVPSAGVFNAALSFGCSGLPAEAQCTFNPASIDPGTTTGDTTVTIATTAPHSTAPRVTRAGGAVPFVLSALGLAGCARTRRRARRRLGWMVLALALLAGSVACSHPQQQREQQTPVGGTPTGSYAVTLIATSGTHIHSTTLVLIVQ